MMRGGLSRVAVLIIIAVVVISIGSGIYLYFNNRLVRAYVLTYVFYPLYYKNNYDLYLYSNNRGDPHLTIISHIGTSQDGYTINHKTTYPDKNTIMVVFGGGITPPSGAAADVMSRASARITLPTSTGKYSIKLVKKFITDRYELTITDQEAVLTKKGVPFFTTIREGRAER